MSDQVTARVRVHSLSTGVPRAVLVALAQLADDDGLSRASFVDIARRAGTVKRHAIRCVDKLVTSGEIERQAGDEGRGHLSTYWVTVGLSEERKFDIRITRFVDAIKGDSSPEEKVTRSTGQKVTSHPATLPARHIKGDSSPEEKVTRSGDPDRGEAADLEKVTPGGQIESPFLDERIDVKKGDSRRVEKVTSDPATLPARHIKGDSAEQPEGVSEKVTPESPFTSEAYSGPGIDLDQDSRSGPSDLPSSHLLAEKGDIEKVTRAVTPPIVMRYYDITGRLQDNPQYVWISTTLAAHDIAATKWSVPNMLPPAERPGIVRERCRRFVMTRPELIAALPDLRGKTLVYFHSPDRAWAETLADLAATPDAELRVLLPEGYELASPPPGPEELIRQVGAVPMYGASCVHGADSPDAVKCWCGQPTKRMGKREQGRELKLCQACSRRITGEVQPNIAILNAWWQGIPVEIRPPGEPPVGRNIGAASDMANWAITPDQVRTFMDEVYPQYVTWASQKLMPLTYVKAHIREHFNGEALARKLATTTAGANGHENARDEARDPLALPAHVRERNERNTRRTT